MFRKPQVRSLEPACDVHDLLPVPGHDTWPQPTDQRNARWAADFESICASVRGADRLSVCHYIVGREQLPSGTLEIKSALSEIIQFHGLFVQHLFSLTGLRVQTKSEASGPCSSVPSIMDLQGAVQYIIQYHTVPL